VESGNLDLIRSIYAAWERGDFSSMKWAHPEIEFVIADGPAPGSWRGHAGLAEGSRSFLGAWEDYHADVEEYRELPSELLGLRCRSARHAVPIRCPDHTCQESRPYLPG
jgi:hypothetical protein